jgi:gamma-glutamylcyclotransferase (GGCT)/AIG2-like uncharacterized protein YtfP
MSNALFAYGTLMVPEIWQAVTQLPGPSPSRPGLLRGYQRRRVEGADFPGIFASGNNDDIVPGCAYEDVAPKTFDLLDRYEDHFYQRLEVNVEVDDGQPATLSCQTYIIPETGLGILSDEPWDLDDFKANALKRYLEALGIES